MKLNRVAAVVAVVLAVIFATSCGETFRQVATPIFSGGGDPQNLRYAVVISDSATGGQGTGTQINVSGDTVASQVALGTGSIHATILGNQIWTANSLEASTTHYFSFLGAAAQPGTTTLSAPPVFMFANSSTVFAALKNPNPLLPGTQISIINPAAAIEAAPVTVGTSPVAITGTSDGSRVYVANQGSNNVTVVNSDGSVKTTIPVGTSPSAIAINQDSSLVYVVNSGSNSVSVIDTATEAVTTTIPVGPNPTFAKFDPVALRLYVANTGGNTVSVISVTSLVATATVGANPTGVAPLADGTRYYVCHSGATVASVVSSLSNTQIRTIPVGSGAKSCAASPESSKVYVANTASGTVSVIRTSDDTVVATVTLPAGQRPQYVFISN
jgi:YVTN family beta-propeller protein